MAKKGSFIKTVIGIGSVVVAGKVAYNKYKVTRDKFEKEENESAEDEVKKYNAIATSRTIEYDANEVFTGCDIKAVGAKVVLDLSVASIEKDVYVNFKTDASSFVIVLPEYVNVVCDVEKVASLVRNEVINNMEGCPTVYVMGESKLSVIDVIPVDFYDEADESDDESDFVVESDEI